MTTRATISAVAVAVAIAIAVITSCSSPAPPAAPVVVAATPDATTPAPTPVIKVPIVSTEPDAMRKPVPPVRVRLAAVGIDVPVIPVGMEADRQIELPEDPAVAGWYQYGPDPTTGVGNTVIAAHIDAPQYPIGPFASLRDVPPGAQVQIDSADGSMYTYQVETVTFYPKQALPVAAIFARTGSPALVLITCGGQFNHDTGHYADNVVLIAKPTP